MRQDRASVDRPITAASAAGPDGAYLAFDAFAEWGITALITTRRAGSFASASTEPAATILGRWDALQAYVAGHGASRMATLRQVHGADLVEHVAGWRGWLRGSDADGHLAAEQGTALVITVADCVPVYVAHLSGATAMLHAGWRGTAAGILPSAIARLAARGCPTGELRVLTGPAICGSCYEVSPDVFAQLTGRHVERPTPVALDAVLAEQAVRAGVRDVRTTDLCTRCDNGLFFSHRARDPGRQIGVLVAG